MKRFFTLALLLGALVACQSPIVDALVALDAAPGSDSAHGDAMAGTTHVFVDCTDTFANAHAGDACKLEKDCTVALKCSQQTARCVNGVLFFSTKDGCPDCTDDLECGSQLLCIEQHCTVCPEPTNCPACPKGFDYLSRNGCKTCECGPVPECSSPKGCTDGYQCALGAYCAQGCSRFDCCANVCADPGCPEPAPLGCVFACDDAGCGGLCKAETCWCDVSTKSWQCKGFCAGDAASIIPCKVPTP